MTAAKNLPPFVAHTGGNQEQSIVGVVGTLGTSDTGGTAAIMPVGVNAATGAMYVQDLSGASGTTNIQGSVQVTGGSIVVTVGTMTNTGTNVNIVSGSLVGTVVNNQNTGTLTTGSLSNLAMVNAGTFVQASGTTTLVSTVTTLSNLTNGSVNILTGTLQSSGTITGVGVVTALTNGSVTMQVGTLTTGTLQNLATGTLNAVTSVTNVAGGTFQRSSIPVQLGTPLVTVGTTGAAVWGTLVTASGAGTKQYVARTSIVVTSGTVDVAVTNIGIGGSTGAGVLERGQFPAGGGITNQYDPVIASGTNGTLSYWLGGAGTVAITVNYWQGV